MKTINTLMILSLFLATSILAQSSNTPWNGKKAAIVLSYDDCLDDQLDKVIPTLNKNNFKATFYVTGESNSLKERKAEWQTVSKQGHELGNHTINHPCIGKSMGRDWVTPEKDLDNYTVDQFVKEIKSASILLNEVDGKDKRSFAYTCGDKAVHDTSFVELIQDDFVAMRGVIPGIKTIDKVDLKDVNAFMVEEKHSAEDLIKLVDEAKEKNGLLVFLFHGIGGNYALDFKLEKHEKLIAYLKANENDLWIAPMIEVGQFIKDRQSKK